MITGPYIENWRGVFEPLIGQDAAVIVAEERMLGDAWAEALDHPAIARARAERASVLAQADQASLDVAVERLLALLA